VGLFATIGAILYNKKLFDNDQYLIPIDFFKTFVKDNAVFIKRNIESINNINDLLY